MVMAACVIKGTSTIGDFVLINAVVQLYMPTQFHLVQNSYREIKQGLIEVEGMCSAFCAKTPKSPIGTFSLSFTRVKVTCF
jgi:ABC-type transport system involved in Fe-S cluster assembly fused permease/ATPase subunit